MMVEIAGYELLEKIGEGGMATVWKARQLSLDRLVAIKLLGKTSLPDQEARDLFRKEAQTAARLNHPGIVHVFDTGEVGDSAYLVMEYVDGQTVADLIHEHGAIPESRALEFVESVAQALAYAWEKECLIHCDVNPSNMLIDRTTGRIKVADLGLARMITLKGARSEDGLIFGTPNYTSPEQSTGLADLDCRADIYSLGASLYHMATGVLPFRDATGSQAMVRHEQDFLDDPQLVNPSISTPAAWLIEKMMIKNRAMRQHFWTQAIKDIEEVRRGHMPTPPLPEPGASTVRRAESRVVPKARETIPMVAKKEPIKLVIKKETPPPAPPPEPVRGKLAATVQWLLSLFIMAAVVYGVLTYVGILDVPSSPFGRPTETVSDDAPPLVDADMTTTEEETLTEPWRSDDFINGARLFNLALAEYKNYQETRADPSVLAQIEENCRDAISYFEAARETAPETINIGQYIEQCYGLISNVRFSTKLGDEETTPEDEPAPVKPPVTASASPTRTVVFVDDEPTETAAAEPVKAPENLLRVSLGTGWDQASGVTVYGREWQRLLGRHVTPTRDPVVNASVILYPGISCMMPARDAARVLQRDLPVRRPVTTPGLPKNSLVYYQFVGEFSGAQQLTLVCDQNDRVLMVQLFDQREVAARLEPALFSANWSVIDFIGGTLRAEDDGLIAHRVRKQDGLIRLNSELAVAAGNNRMVKTRVQLMMPEQMAGMILQVAQSR